MRNSVLEELRVRRFAEVICSRWAILESVTRSEREKVEYHLRTGSGLEKSEETNVLSGLVYMMKNTGPRIEP